MTSNESNQVVEEVKTIFGKISEHSQKAELDSFLSFYDNSPQFISISSEGKISDFDAFKAACSEYYALLQRQEVVTLTEKFNVVDKDLVIMSWAGNIIAHLKNGDTIVMNNYSITSVFQKINESWIVIHDHESALPPEVIASKK
jgi:hypothetical protein